MLKKIVIVILALSSMALARSAAAADVPARYAPLYDGLERLLDAAEARWRSSSAPSDGFRPIYSTDLLAANSNRGPALLQPDTLPVVRLSLDRFKAMGIQNVKFALQYPLLRPDFPRAPEYLAFYRQVVDEAHARGLKVMPHVTVLFADTPFSPFRGIYAGLDFERFKREYRDMVRLVVRELRPDYLGLVTEPDTHARLTGLREFLQPAKVVELVRFALRDLDRSTTLVGAGSGSWSPPTFAESLARQTDVDFIAIHIYPISGPMLSNAAQMARIAHANGKQAFIDEAWLYKILKPGGGDNVAAASEVYRRDVYSFWQPLDQRFMSVILGLARAERIGLVSFFWSGLFFGYLDYAPDLDRVPYQELARRHNRLAYDNMRSGVLSSTGEYLRRSAAGGR